MTAQRLGPYVLLEPLGKGAQGSVWRARDEHTGAVAAIKVLRPGDDGRAERFRREAEAATRVRHPNVVSVLASGSEGELSWIAYELAPGGDLAGLLERRGALPWTWAVGIARDVARGLVAIHAAGLVHRDLKPGNVLLDEKGEARITDFGLAAGVVAGSDLTKTGDVLGTPAYISPEQADGRRDVTGASDCYALGALIFEVVSGERPFRAAGLALLKAHMFERAPRLAERAKGVPAELDRLVATLLEKDAAARPDAAQVVRTLETIGRAKGRDRRLGLLVVPGIALAAVLGWRALAPVPTVVVPPAALPPPPATASPPANEPGEPPQSDDELRFMKAVGFEDRATVEGAGALNFAISQNPTWFHARALRAEVAISRNELPEATRELDDLIARFPRFARLHVLRGEARWHANDREAAVAALDSAVRLAPDSAEARAYRAAFTFFLKHESGAPIPPPVLDQIMVDANKALESVQGEPRALVLTTRAYVRELGGDYARAGEDWDALLRMPLARDRRSVTLVKRAYILVGQGDRARARVLLDEALSLDPRSADGHAVRALLREKDDPKGAAADYEKSLELAPNQPNAAYYRQKIAALSAER